MSKSFRRNSEPEYNPLFLRHAFQPFQPFRLDSTLSNFSEKVAFIWSVADLLRGPYKPHQYGRVILPLTVLRRLDCVLEPTKPKMLEKHAALKSSGICASGRSRAS